jgi:hypothetical protein
VTKYCIKASNFFTCLLSIIQSFEGILPYSARQFSHVLIACQLAFAWHQLATQEELRVPDEESR